MSPTVSDQNQLESSTVNRTWYLLLTLLLSSLAGGMAWGIRGQYGHETGAMIFGPLVGFTLVMLYLPRAGSWQAARTVALLTMAVGFGGSMSYGETVGLTHDHELHRKVVVNEEGEETFVKERHWRAYRWGMIGLFVKGGLWIGFAGAFLGIGLGGKKYNPKEMLGLGVGMMGLILLGIWLLNSPFDPANKILPSLYFSDHWMWEDEQYVKPRPECWGGVLFAFAGLLTYLIFVKRDRLAVNMALWGVVGGLGFPVGQFLQAEHGLDAEAFRQFFPVMYGVNTWNLMEVTFGLVAGFALGLGTWFNRKQIVQSVPEQQETVDFSFSWEVGLMLVYLYFLLVGWFLEDSFFGYFYEFGHLMGLIPMVAIMGGRYWPFWYVFPVVAMPIAVKTFRAISLSSGENPPFIPTSIGWVMIVTVPLILLTLLATHFAQQSMSAVKARKFACVGLLVSSAVYFWWNFAFFRFPWSWLKEWDFQNNSGMIYIVSWLVLSVAALCFMKTAHQEQKQKS